MSTCGDILSVKISNIKCRFNLVLIITELISKLLPCFGKGDPVSLPMNVLGAI